MIRQNKMRRVYEIDFMRFVAALMVLMYHYTFTGFNFGNMPHDFMELSAVSRYGYLGVDLFFMISGFVILLSAQNKGPFDFLKSRIVRLYPAYVIGVMLTASIIWFWGDGLFTVSISQFFYNLPMIGGYFGVEMMDTVYWTLLIELKFYFLIFILVLFKQIKYIVNYLWIWSIVTFVFLFIHPVSILNVFFIPSWSPYFISGAVFFIAKQNGFSRSLYFLLLINFLFAIYNSIVYIQYLEPIVKGSFSILVVSIVLFLFYCLMFMVVFDKVNFFNKSYMIYFGVITYPLYLIHQKIGFIIFTSNPLLNKYVALFLVFLVMIVGSFLLHKFIEHPIANYLNRLFKCK